MRFATAVLTLLLLFTLATSAPAAPQKSAAPADPAAQRALKVQRLADMQKHFADYSQQFGDLARTDSDLEPSYDAATDLQGVADLTRERLAAVTAFLQIYSDIERPEEKAKAAPRITAMVAVYRSGLDASMKRIDFAVTRTQQLGIISKADHMRADMKDFAKILDSIKLL